MTTEPKQITEEDTGIIDEWFEKKLTLDELPKFVEHLLNDYKHDYGTICHAVSAALVQTVKAMNGHEQGGITGFQANFIAFEFVRRLLHLGAQPLKFVMYENMLYPQYSNKFSKTISHSTWRWLQAEAQKKLCEQQDSDTPAHPDVIAHWRSIVDGKIPFGYELE